jgi:hypothetical protein
MLACFAGSARAEHGAFIYRARVIHNNRSAMSIVSGTVDIASGDYTESVDKTYRLDFKQMPAQLEDAQPELPAVWGEAGRTAQRWGTGLPRYDSPLLRHFLIGNVMLHPEALKPGAGYLSGQLEIIKVTVDANRFEVVAKLRGGALVITGSRQQLDGVTVPRDMAVLGSSGELYQYLFDEVHLGAEQQIALPTFDPQQYISFPTGDSTPVATRPIKDWLVFQAELPSGRKLNLLFDSGADTMIVDDMVLRLDAGLDPVGETLVDSGIGSGMMHLYQGFGFKVGGVEFKNLPVMGGTLTSVTAGGGGVRIHGIVGNEILQLCQLDLDLAGGTLKLRQPDSPEPGDSQKVDLTFIQQLPHIYANVADKGPALLLLDTGQRTPLSLNLDYLDEHKMADSLVMDGFLGGIKGSLLPRYMLEKVQLNLAGQSYTEKTVDATPVNTYAYDGIPVAGAIGFSMLARHFGGLTFDYRRRALYLREPGQDLHFTGRPEAWGGDALARAKLDEDQPAATPVRPSEIPEYATATHSGGSGEIAADTQAASGQPATQFAALPPDPPTVAGKKSPNFRINRRLSGKRVGERISKHQYYVHVPEEQ